MPRLVLAALLLAMPLAAQTADHRYPFVRDGKLGFIDGTGKEVIPAQFQPIGDFAHFSEGLAPVDGPDGAGYIDPSGVAWKDGYGYIDKAGRTVWRSRGKAPIPQALTEVPDGEGGSRS